MNEPKQFKIPKHIRKHMNACTRYAIESEKHSRIVDDWFEQHGFNIEKLRDTTYSDMNYTGCSYEILEREIAQGMEDLKS